MWGLACYKLLLHDWHWNSFYIPYLWYKKRRQQLTKRLKGCEHSSAPNQALNRGMDSFFWKRPVVNTLGFVDHVISAATPQLYHGSKRAATDSKLPNKHSCALKKQEVSWIWPESPDLTHKRCSEVLFNSRLDVGTHHACHLVWTKHPRLSQTQG